MENQKTIDALRNFREQLAADLLSGAQHYEIGDTISYNDYVSVTTVVDNITLSMSVNEKGYICYHNDLIKGMFANEKAFANRVFGEFHANEIANAMKRKGELHAEIEKLDEIIGGNAV